MIMSERVPDTLDSAVPSDTHESILKGVKRPYLLFTGSSLSIMDKDGAEVLYWHEDEWLENPIEVVPAMLKACYLVDQGKLDVTRYQDRKGFFSEVLRRELERGDISLDGSFYPFNWFSKEEIFDAYRGLIPVERLSPSRIAYILEHIGPALRGEDHDSTIAEVIRDLTQDLVLHCPECDTIIPHMRDWQRLEHPEEETYRTECKGMMSHPLIVSYVPHKDAWVVTIDDSTL